MGIGCQRNGHWLRPIICRVIACAANNGVVVCGREVCRLGSEYIRQLANVAVQSCMSLCVSVCVLTRPRTFLHGKFLAKTPPEAVLDIPQPFFLRKRSLNNFLLGIPLPGQLSRTNPTKHFPSSRISPHRTSSPSAPENSPWQFHSATRPYLLHELLIYNSVYWHFSYLCLFNMNIIHAILVIYFYLIMNIVHGYAQKEKE